MRAICTTVTRSGKVKSVTGKVLQRGLGVITIVLTNKDGTQSIRRFDESKYTVKVFD
ncbi:D-alanyl-D-alanine carboxypeptidase [Paenibacillus popilliae ATCC 14706]|uniref:D-alanyl-D-alanine carboxypeptidase n=1 Tax=Paenibacillus popilliae ATCC 14706 TaxID=1212764 RepID=M9LCL1_PAEPP|nr:D-alanyl-D-alanine carboxypeptidase [Paenibacillus popilliae ATCC 14706]